MNSSLIVLNNAPMPVTPKMISKIENLTIEKLENLGEDFLDFNNITDLENWLNQQ